MDDSSGDESAYVNNNGRRQDKGKPKFDNRRGLTYDGGKESEKSENVRYV